MNLNRLSYYIYLTLLSLLKTTGLAIPKECQHTCAFLNSMKVEISKTLHDVNIERKKYEKIIRPNHCGYNQCYTFKQDTPTTSNDNYERLQNITGNIKYLLVGLPQNHTLNPFMQFLQKKTTFVYQCFTGKIKKTHAKSNNSSMKLLKLKMCEDTNIKYYSYYRQVKFILRRSYTLYQDDITRKNC